MTNPAPNQQPQSQQQAAFNPMNVPITVTFNYQQVNLILEGLGKLPLERVEVLYGSLRGLAVDALGKAETAFNEKDKAPAVPAAAPDTGTTATAATAAAPAQEVAP